MDKPKNYAEALTRNPEDQELFNLIDEVEKKYEYETEMAADIDVLAMSRKALEDNDAWLEENDLVDQKHNPIVGEILMVVAGYAGLFMFITACFALAKL